MHHSPTFLVLSIVSGGIAAHCHAGVIRHDRFAQFHETFAMAEPYRAAGELTNNGQGYASATLIAPGWILTAAHATDGLSPERLQFRHAGGVYNAVETFEHPLWMGNSRITEGFDIALVRLDREVDGVSPAELYSRSDVLGRSAVLVGAGLTGNGITGQLPGTTGTLRAGRNVFDTTSDQLSEFFPGIVLSPNGLVIDFDDPRGSSLNRTGDSVPLENEFFPGGGDSGGAYWVEDADGQWKLAAIQSWGTVNVAGDNFGKYGNLAVSSRLNDTFTHDWIASTIPSPSSMATLAFAGFFTTRRMRR